MGHKVWILMKSEKEFVGTLRGFDDFVNVVRGATSFKPFLFAFVSFCGVLHRKGSACALLLARPLCLVFCPALPFFSRTPPPRTAHARGESRSPPPLLRCWRT